MSSATVQSIPRLVLGLLVLSAACSPSHSDAPPPANIQSMHSTSTPRSNTQRDASAVAVMLPMPSDAGRDRALQPDSGAAQDAGAPQEHGLSWPIACQPGSTCAGIGYPDIDGDNQAFNCEAPGYQGHEGTDIRISQAQMDDGMDVYAAADGVVQWVFDGRYDRCPDATQPDCAAPSEDAMAGKSSGYRVCTPLGNFCDQGSCCCFWCFNGGNVIVILHHGVPGVFATRYDHLKRGSIRIAPGDNVKRGQAIAQAGSAGDATGPHLHFEVWSTGFYKLADPWAGPCGPNKDDSLWLNDPPWQTR